MKIKKGKLYLVKDSKILFKADFDADNYGGFASDKIAVYCPTKNDWDYVNKKMNWEWEYSQDHVIRLLNNGTYRLYNVQEAEQKGYHVITIHEFKEFYPPQADRCVNEKDNMKIKKGDKFLCIKDVVMSYGDIAYKKGEIYTSERDYCITDISGNKEHTWDEKDIIIQYFKPLKDVDRVYTDATDRLRELYGDYKGDKFGDPTKAKFFGVKFSDGEVLYLSANDEYENPFFNRDYVTEDTFIELTGLTDKSTVYQDEYSWVNNGLQDVPVKNTFNPKPYYDNSKGSLYKVATERGWSSYIFDVVKRLERGGKKDPLKQEIEKSIDVLKIWLNEIE